MLFRSIPLTSHLPQQKSNSPSLILRGFPSGPLIRTVSSPGANRGSYNVTIRRCVFDRNYRQGISVIGVDGFLVEDTELTNTKGTPPLK